MDLKLSLRSRYLPGASSSILFTIRKTLTETAVQLARIKDIPKGLSPFADLLKLRHDLQGFVIGAQEQLEIMVPGLKGCAKSLCVQWDERLRSSSAFQVSAGIYLLKNHSTADLTGCASRFRIPAFSLSLFSLMGILYLIKQFVDFDWLHKVVEGAKVHSLNSHLHISMAG